MATDKTTTPDQNSFRNEIKATVIISVYKNVRVLEAVLHSLERQTNQDFEIIISEDGNDKDMERFVSSYPFKWRHLHLTQEDKGWRKERSLNRAVVAAHTDWLIFIDGDCILHPRFVEFHIKYSHKGVILAGKRVKLNEDLSKKMLDGKKICFVPYLFNRRGCRYIEEAFFIPAAQWLRRSVKHLLGSNMSMSRSDLMAINGFDENYTLPATGEDYDIEWRMIMNGCRIVSLRNLAVQYHIHHKENWNDNKENMNYCRKMQEKKQIICKNGIEKH